MGNLLLAKKPKTTTLSAISFSRTSKKDAASILIARILAKVIIIFSTFYNLNNFLPSQNIIKRFMSLEKINLILNKLESNIKNHSVSKPEISKGDVPLHIDQSLKVINNVIIALQKSNPNTYKNDISLLG